MYKIYKLVHKGEVIYIGYTENKLNIRKNGRYTHIPIEIKKESSIELIEETNDKSRERYWIQFYKDLGCNLYNIFKGDGVDYKEYENRRKKDEKRKQYLKDYNNNEKRKQYLKKYKKDRYNRLKKERQ